MSSLGNKVNNTRNLIVYRTPTQTEKSTVGCNTLYHHHLWIFRSLMVLENIVIALGSLWWRWLSYFPHVADVFVFVFVFVFYFVLSMPSLRRVWLSYYCWPPIRPPKCSSAQSTSPSGSSTAFGLTKPLFQNNNFWFVSHMWQQ